MCLFELCYVLFPPARPAPLTRVSVAGQVPAARARLGPRRAALLRRRGR